MISTVKKIIPHILFLALVIVILLPSQDKVDTFYAFLGVVIAIEAAVLWKRNSDVACNISTIVYLFLLIWEILVAKIGVKNAMLYPAPENVFMIFFKDYEKILEGVLSSLQLLFIAFALALIFGVGLGLVVGLSDTLSGTILPIVRVISPIPPIIYSPYAVALLPTFRTASIFIVTLTIFWSIFMSMVLSVREIDKKLLDSAKTLNLSKTSMVLHVTLPYSLPGIFNSVSVSVSTSFLVLTAAEMIGGTSGLGWYIKYYSDFAAFPKVVFGIIMIGIVVTLLNKLISILRNLVIRWK